MPKQKIEIEVDVPDGWEATGEYRVPYIGDFYVHHTGSSPIAFQNVVIGPRNVVIGPRIILRKKYVPPSWLKPGTWIYKHGSESHWSCSNVRPVVSESAGGYRFAYGSKYVSLPTECFPDFVPPPTNPFQIPEVAK